MKFDDMEVNNTLKSMAWCIAAIALVVVFGLSGCATTSKVDLALDGKVAPQLLTTSAYLPKPKVDKEGNRLPYQARVNPYLKQKGKINKTSITTFIDARRAFKKERYKQANIILDKLVKADKSLSGPWVMKGDIARARKNYDLALKYYARALQINKYNVNAYVRLAKVQRLQGKFVRAQNTYAKALSIWPDFPEAHLNIAVLYDVYINHPLRAQKHMEAYLYLTGSKNQKAKKWLKEIQARTGVAPTLIVEKRKPNKAVPVS